MIVLQKLTAQWVMAFKDVRLRALSDSPSAFSSTFQEEAKLTDDDWLKRAAQWSGADSVTYLAMKGAVACGIASCYLDKNDRARAYLASMWVAPNERRQGVGRMLVNAIAEWARARSIKTLQLIVTDTNHGAIRFYEKLGFVMGEFRGTYRNDPALTESEMIRSL